MNCQPYSCMRTPLAAKYAHEPMRIRIRATSYQGTPRRSRPVTVAPGARLRTGVVMNTIGTNAAISRYRKELVSTAKPPAFQKNTWFMVSRMPATVRTMTTVRQNGVRRGLASCRATSDGMVGDAAASSSPEVRAESCGGEARTAAPVRGLRAAAASPGWYGELMRCLRRVRWTWDRLRGSRGPRAVAAGWTSSTRPRPCARPSHPTGSSRNRAMPRS